jgi:hypothetical protein
VLKGGKVTGSAMAMPADRPNVAKRTVTARITLVMRAGRITRVLRINMRTLWAEQGALDGAEALELAERFVVIFVIVPFLVLRSLLKNAHLGGMCFRPVALPVSIRGGA